MTRRAPAVHRPDPGHRHADRRRDHRSGLAGRFIFSPPDVDERLLGEAGFRLLRHEDVTGNVAAVVSLWHGARARHRAELEADEGAETFRGTQRFLRTALDAGGRAPSAPPTSSWR
ncbi:MAG: hypothetical protein ACRDIZ_11445 [Actinomycetota bacterium]